MSELTAKNAPMPVGTGLDNDDSLLISRELATAIGLNESIIMRQIHYWLRLFAKAKDDKHFRDGQWWVYNTYADWKKDNFGFWSWNTIRRAITTLQDLGLIVASNRYNDRKGDQTKWYSIDYAMHEAYMRLWKEHGCPSAGNGRKSAAYASFIMDWNDQRQDPQIVAKWHDQLPKLDKATAQVGQTVTRDYTETTKEKDSPAPKVAGGSPITKKERPRDEFLDAIVRHVIGIDPLKYENWSFVGKLKKQIVKADASAVADDVAKFAQWCKDEGFSPPNDADKLYNNWLKWRTSNGSDSTNPLRNVKVMN